MKFTNKFKSVLMILCLLLFFSGIILGLTGRAVCMRDTQDYQNLQPELFAPDEIATVLYDANLQQIYVCYNDASYVNVYSESGEFLWALSTPYLRNVYFELAADLLIIYDSSEAYIYKAQNGIFVELKNTDELDLSYDWENEYTDEFESGEFYFDTYQVYRAQADGSLITVVSRPVWYWIFNFGVCWLVSFCGAVGLGIIFFIEKRKDYKSVQKSSAATKQKIVVENRKARFILRYFKIASVIYLIYAVLDVIFGVWFDGILSIGIMPLAIHFIITNIIFLNMLDCISVSEEEKTLLDYWTTFEFGSFIVAFLSVVVAVMLAG